MLGVSQTLIFQRKEAADGKFTGHRKRISGRFTKRHCIAGVLAVVFSPGELALIQQGPAERRAFLDGAISQVMPRYLATLAAMGRILLQRNTLIADMLKSGSAAAMEPLL